MRLEIERYLPRKFGMHAVSFSARVPDELFSSSAGMRGLVRRILLLRGSWQAALRRNSGGALSATDVSAATNDQFYRACSSGGIHQFPYSQASYNAQACNGFYFWSTASQRTTVEVASLAGCQSSLPG